MVVGGCVRHDAIARREQLEVAHVGIVGGEEDADVARDSRQNHTADAERLEQRIERRAEEARVFGLQDEVVAGGRFQPLRDATSGRRPGDTVRDCPSKVGAPLAKIVVDIDRGDSRGVCSPLQCRQPDRHPLRLRHQPVRAVEGEVVDDVDQQQRGPRCGDRDRPTRTMWFR